jgi:putative transposase
MPNYRRWYEPGGTYHFTVVMHQRQPLFWAPEAQRLLGVALRSERRRRPFTTVAMVLLPEHLHCIWTLPRGDADFSTRWQIVKGEFTESWLASGGGEVRPSASRLAKGERGVWQRRFWEHCVRDEDDLERCCHYIHYNPVKHGHVARPRDWPMSSFHRFVRAGDYEPDWGRTEPDPPAFLSDHPE